MQQLFDKLTQNTGVVGGCEINDQNVTLSSRHLDCNVKESSISVYTTITANL